MTLCFRTSLVLLMLLTLWRPSVSSAESHHPLAPVDLSSPRATLTSFLEFGDEYFALIRGRYWTSPSREDAEKIKRYEEIGARMFDLSEIPPGARSELVRDGFAYLYDILSRIELPPLTEIPNSTSVEDATSAAPTGGMLTSWRVPHTEITFVRVAEGLRSGDYVFSSETLRRAKDFYEVVRALPYRRDVQLKNYPEVRHYLSLRSWFISSATIESFPEWLKLSLLNQALWKWIVLPIVFGLTVLLAFLLQLLAYRRLSKLSWSFPLHRLALPLALLSLPVVLAHATYHLSLTGWIAGALILISEGIAYLLIAWIIWVVLTGVADSIIASPRIRDKGVDANLVRLLARSIGIVAVISIVIFVSNDLGAPVYSLVAGLGVGGLALALAIRPTLENIIGSLTLFADKPVRVGDFCKFGEEYGTVEEIGLRSTRLRKWDETLVTIPNSDFSQRELFNLGKRRSRLYHVIINLRYETTPEQLRFVLAKLREMLHGHPKVSPNWLNVRFKGFGPYSLDIEIYAYLRTREWLNFGAICEDINFRVIDIIKEAGTSFAFPSQTTYFSRDSGLDVGRGKEAEASVEEWRSNGKLPFPEHDEKTLENIEDKLDYPPPGSPAYKPQK